MVKTNITQPSFVGGIISQELFSRLDLQKLDSGLKQCENFVIRPSGGAVYRVGTKYIAETKYKNKTVKLVPFVYNRTDGLCLEFGDKYIRFYKDGIPVLSNDGSVYEIATPYEEKDVMNLSYAQDKNNLYIAHQKYAPSVLTRIGDNLWELKELTLNPTVETVSTVSIEKTTAKKSDDIVEFEKWQYAVSIVYDDDIESFAKESGVITSDIDLLNQPIKVTWTVPDSVNLDKVKQFNIYRIKAGEFYQCYTEYPKANERSYTVKDISFSQDATHSPKEKFEDFDVDNYPAVVGVWNQRLVFGNTPKKPSTFWMSRAGQLEDFAGTILQTAADPISLTLNSGTLDAIVGFIPLDNLILLTEGKIWRITGTAADNMSAYIESYTGSSSIKPTATKKSAMFVDSSLNSVSDFVYSDELNGYTGQNLDLLARELIDGYTISDLAFKDTPYGVLYCVRDDGVLLGLTYLREQNIYAWHKHTTKDGKFVAVCSVDKNKQDNVYCTVNRDGVIYIEMFANYINENENEDNSCHLDCATYYISDLHSYRNKIVVTSDELRENIIDKASVGTYSVNITKEGKYKIVLVGGGGGSSTANGGGGAGVEVDINLPIGVYNLTVGKGGAGAASYARNHNGEKGSLSSFIGTGVSIVANGGNGGVGLRNGNESQTPAARGSVVITTDFEYTIVDKSIDGEKSRTSWYSKKDEGFGAGAKSVGTESKGKDGESGYINVIRLYKETQEYFNKIVYTKGTPNIGDNVYSNINFDKFGTVESLDGENIVSDGETFYLYNKTEKFLNEFGGLERFENKVVSCLIDGDVYKDVAVKDGKIIFDKEFSSVLIGLPYTGIIETIPYDRVFSSGNSSVGYNRRITKGELSYYRTRGLKYGTAMNRLYEVKPYRDEEFGERMTLETNILTLDVADGFSKENTFFVVQDQPLPALVRNITLGSKLNG